MTDEARGRLDFPYGVRRWHLKSRRTHPLPPDDPGERALHKVESAFGQLRRKERLELAAKATEHLKLNEDEPL